MNLLREKKQKISNVKVSIKVKHELKQIKKYDDDEIELDRETKIEEDIEDEKKETEKSKDEGTTHLPMYIGEADIH